MRKVFVHQTKAVRNFINYDFTDEHDNIIATGQKSNYTSKVVLLVNAKEKVFNSLGEATIFLQNN